MISTYTSFIKIQFGNQVIIISIIAVLGGCGSNKKAPPTPRYSHSINESKKNGVFQFEVVADKSVWTPDNGLTFRIKEAWVENEWYIQNYMIGKETMSKVDADEIILKLNIDSVTRQGTNHFYYFIGNKRLDTFIHYFCHRIDTIKVPLYRETSNDLPSRKDRKAFDTITFVKRITSG